MKPIYSLYVSGLALILVSGILLAYPPIALAATCETTCSNGDIIRVSGTSCTCTENGCTWVDSNGRQHTRVCPYKNGDE